MRFPQNKLLKPAFLVCCCETFLLKKPKIMAFNSDNNTKSKPDVKPASFLFSESYANPWKTWNFKMYWSALKMTQTQLWNDTSGIPSEKELDETLPVERYDDHDHKITKQNMHKVFEGTSKGVKFMWIGHASCMVKVDGVTFLADPMFSKWCSPIAGTGPWRYRDPPCSVLDLPHIDAVVISHNHYDHLDKKTVLELNKRFGQKLHWFVPKGMKSWLKGKTSVDENVTELSWWKESTLNGVRFVFTPTQHWCGRLPPRDTNKVLWGSWSVIGSTHKFFFGGDTGYCEAFKEIGKEFGPFDLAAIPIGAYTPREVLKCQHVNPEEAIEIHKDIKSKESIGIHWGTFKMTYEPYLEPKELIESLTKEEKNKDVIFYTIKHGQIIESGKYIETAVEAAAEEGIGCVNIDPETRNKSATEKNSETGISRSSQLEVKLTNIETGENNTESDIKDFTENRNEIEMRPLTTAMSKMTVSEGKIKSEPSKEISES